MRLKFRGLWKSKLWKYKRSSLKVINIKAENKNCLENLFKYTSSSPFLQLLLTFVFTSLELFFQCSVETIQIELYNSGYAQSSIWQKATCSLHIKKRFPSHSSITLPQFHNQEVLVNVSVLEFFQMQEWSRKQLQLLLNISCGQAYVTQLSEMGHTYANVFRLYPEICCVSVWTSSKQWKQSLCSAFTQ